MLAKALSSRWRARIWAELALRPMSPSQFVREIGGEPSHIARRFRELAKWELIELVETRRGGRRRGGVEHVYRAVRRAWIETDEAARLPLPMREEISANVLSNYVDRVAQALEAGTFDAEVDRHLSYDVVRVDRQGWTELIAELDQTLGWVPSLAVQSAQRLGRTGEEPIPTTVGMTGFRSPDPADAGRSGAPRPSAEGGAAVASPDLAALEANAPLLGTTMVKALASPWRAKVLAEVSVRPMSPSRFVREVGGELDHISRCFRQLANWEILELAETRPARGRGPVAVEHVYRVARRVHFSDDVWEEVPQLLRDEVSRNVLANYFGRISEAFAAGSFDAEAERHLSYDVLALDRQAWNRLATRLAEILALVPRLEAEASARLARSDEEVIVATVGLMAFRSPPGGER